ncbi:LacI family transcriptional regulator [Mesorhizobium sp. B3-1-9]|nr:LacI family transcriptional regulator [Mesorhizobium sp. B3-1-9]
MRGHVAATIKDIARGAGVSIATVSKVLNRKDAFISEETRSRIWSLARELNYTPNSIARSLVTRRSQVLGIIVPDILNPYFTELVRACDDAARQRGYTTILCNSDGIPDKEEAHLAFLAGHGVDGIVLAASGVIPNAGLLRGLNIPFVSMDREVPELDCLAATVDTDYRNGAFQSAGYLIAKGHTRIVFLSGSAESSNTRIRLAGFEEAHRQAGIAVDRDLVRCGEFQHSFGRQATRELLESTRFSAICCMSDMLAIGATVALREKGLVVPDDCAVMGFDNIYLAPLLERPLSTIDRRIFEAGTIAIDALVDFLEGPDRRRAAIVMEPSVVERKTA